MRTRDVATGWIPSHNPSAAGVSSLITQSQCLAARLVLGLHLVNLLSEDGVSPRGKDGRWTWTMDVDDGCGRWTRQWRANTKATRAVAICRFKFSGSNSITSPSSPITKTSIALMFNMMGALWQGRKGDVAMLRWDDGIDAG
eukprot:scaffold31534_cov45-Cyclotella_meneghiniana.AAC.1